MREIKFRGWVGGKMITPCAWINEENLPCYRMGSAPKKPLMQFAGLQDVNGVDIYEGDIVSHANGQVWTVEYSENEAAFVVYNQLNSTRRLWSSFGDHYFLDDDNTMNFAAVFSIGDVEEWPCVVVGNIYENPELVAS